MIVYLIIYLPFVLTIGTIRIINIFSRIHSIGTRSFENSDLEPSRNTIEPCCKIILLVLFLVLYKVEASLLVVSLNQIKALVVGMYKLIILSYLHCICSVYSALKRRSDIEWRTEWITGWSISGNISSRQSRCDSDKSTQQSCGKSKKLHYNK
jgi:hypothetical protein